MGKSVLIFILLINISVLLLISYLLYKYYIKIRKENRTTLKIRKRINNNKEATNSNIKKLEKMFQKWKIDILYDKYLDSPQECKVECIKNGFNLNFIKISL